MTGLLTVAALLVGGWVWNAASPNYAFESESRLWFEGTSTMHGFTCTAQKIVGTLASDRPESLQALSRVEVAVPAESIDCGKSQMNTRMLKALNTRHHPVIRYTLDNTEVVAGPASDGSYRLMTTGSLAINGQQQPIQMIVTGWSLPGGKLRFEGKKEVRMSAYGIDPPSMFMGTVKTGDEVIIYFDVVAGRAP